jgi:carboxylate-amine ligase
VLDVDASGVRRSVELEYWVVDDRGRLTGPGDIVSAAPGVEREFVEPLVEVKTTPCETTTALREELCDRLERTLQRAEAEGKRLVPLATPVGDAEIEALGGARGDVQAAVVGDAFRHVRHCAGTHVHVEQADGQVIDQLNALIALDPALALVNSSPYYRGERVAASARSQLYRWQAYDDVPYQGRLWRYASDRAEWRRRLERRYEEFERAAMDAGVDRRTVAANFDPENAVWTPVRLREAFPTVEWRSPDTTVPSEAIRLADGVAAVVDHAAHSWVRVDGRRPTLTKRKAVLPEFDAVLARVEEAVSEGLASDAVCSYLDRLGFPVDAFDPLSRQFDHDPPLDVDTVREIRLDAADRLRRDIKTTARARAD